MAGLAERERERARGDSKSTAKPPTFSTHRDEHGYFTDWEHARPGILSLRFELVREQVRNGIRVCPSAGGPKPSDPEPASA